MTGECLWTGRPGTLSRYTGTYYSYRPACHTASLIPETRSSAFLWQCRRPAMSAISTSLK